MYSLKFVLASTLLAPLVEFVTSSSGHVEPRKGLAMGWLGSVVAGLAAVLVPAERAQAVPSSQCHGIPEGAGSKKNCKEICLTNKPCRYDSSGRASGWYRAKYCNSANYGCQQIGGWSCSC